MTRTGAATAALRALQAVHEERARRSADPALHARVTLVKRYQQARFERSYADLMVDARHAPACRFFLEELYGPGDFEARDRQFGRVLAKLMRMFPRDVHRAVGLLLELHALSEALDTAMGAALSSTERLTRADYRQAWRSVGRPADRQRQLDNVIALGQEIEVLAHHALLVGTLRLMRGPAQAAGLGAIQQMLEGGLSAFRAMNGSAHFLAVVQAREQRLIDALALPRGGDREVLGWLPEQLLSAA